MTKKRRPERPEDKVEESASADSDMPLEKFKALVRKLVNVPREAVIKEQRIYEAERMAKKKRDR